jgi:hypothetical protein
VFLRRLNRTSRPSIEALELRRLLSAAVGDLPLHPDYVRLPSDSSSTDVQGVTPSQISKAYNFDKIQFGDGSVPADGQGQTIAIIDAFDDPNLSGDLNVFDTQFGLPAPPSLSVVNQTGGTILPSVDPDWASETALDVEWAHAIAPGASILVVETDTDDTDDLMAGVNYARGAPGVSVVSLSWGGSEFVNFGGSESESQLKFDADFATPPGHEGVTFVAAAGDDGPQPVAEWPASSPDVLSVGGTTLSFADNSGSYGSEASWTFTSGGYSTVETEPTYQEVAETSGRRSGPDVAYNADPNTGFAVYDSLEDQGYVGWQVVGGTSSGTPQWAALIAIADQGRVLAGKSSLDSFTQTLPALYSLYSPPNTAGYSSYTGDFNDIDADDPPQPHPHRAVAGYDTITGLGTPHADKITSALVATNGVFAPSMFATSPITDTFTKAPPATVVGGSAGSIGVRLIDPSAVPFTGPISIVLSAANQSPDSAGETILLTRPVPTFKLAAHQSKVVNLKFDYPTSLQGTSENLVATVSTTAIATTPARTVSVTPVAVEFPTVDLAAMYTAKTALLVKPARGATAAVKIENIGNVFAIGTLGAVLFPSTDSESDTSAILASITNRPIRIAPGNAIVVQLHFIDPAGDIGGTFDLVASITSSTQPVDDDLANDFVTIPTRAPG